MPISVQRLPGGPGQGFPRTADYYPDAALRLGEQGSVSVQVCVAGNGRLTSDPAIAQSSGSARLDGGALALAKAGSGSLPSRDRGRPARRLLLHVPDPVRDEIGAADASPPPGGRRPGRTGETGQLRAIKAFALSPALL